MIYSVIKWLKEWFHYLESSRMGIGIPDDYREDWHFCYLCIWEGQQGKLKSKLSISISK